MLKYNNIYEGRFIDRPNRFIANVEINGKSEVCHVKNTGRCKELLVAGCKVYLERSDSPNRKTKYDLVAVQKGERLINMDSQAPNKAVYEWLKKERPFGENMIVTPEITYGNSRFDFCISSENSDKVIYLEVKGCTLEKDGVVLFPDAPTERGLKHINELIKCSKDGCGAVVLILVQMENVKYFTPNYETHEAFGNALKKAQKEGVTILCYDSIVTPKSIDVGKPVRVQL